MNNFISSYVSSHKTGSFKNKNLRYTDIIRRSFNFTYAGNINVFIEYQRNIKKYILVCMGFTYDGYNVFFGDHRYFRRQFETLYGAILSFHKVVQLFIDNLDWFGKEYFDSCEFYNFANEELFK